MEPFARDSRTTAGSQPDEPSEANPQSPILTYLSDSLFRGQREIRIAHEGQTYRLRVTKGGKLILNK